MIRKRSLQLAILLLGAVIVAGGAWAFLLRPVGVHVVETERDVPIQVFGLGTVEAQILSHVGFEVAGTLIKLHADYGDRVAAGTLLARLDSREQEARIAQAKAAVAQAESAIRQADAAIERAQANLTQKAQANERRQELVRQGNVSIEAAQDAQSAYDMARAELGQARSGLEVARANLEQAKAQAELEEARLAKYALHAPYDAVVVTRHRELGSVLGPGEDVFTVVDPTTVWALAYVEEQRAGLVEVGQSAALVLRSLPRARFKGRVVRIDIESDRVNEERRIYVRCDDCPPDFHLGEQVEVLITAGKLERALLVPRAALVRTDGETATVWTLEDGRLAQRDVSLGARTGDGRVQIVGELPADAQVIANTAAGLRIGRRAVIVRDEQ